MALPCLNTSPEEATQTHFTLTSMIGMNWKRYIGNLDIHASYFQLSEKEVLNPPEVTFFESCPPRENGAEVYRQTHLGLSFQTVLLFHSNSPWCPNPGTKTLIPKPWYRDLVVRILVPRCLTSGTRISVPRSWYQYFGAKNFGAK